MNELKNIAPNLSKVKKENFFRIPDGYFEEFPGKLMERIGRQGERQKVLPPYRRLFKSQFAIAAAIVVFAVLGTFQSDILFRMVLTGSYRRRRLPSTWNITLRTSMKSSIMKYWMKSRLKKRRIMNMRTW